MRSSGPPSRVAASRPIAVSSGLTYSCAVASTRRIDMRTRSPASIDFIVSLNVAYASAAFAQIVSPPNGGTSTAYSMLMAGGRGRNAESVCHPEPKIIATSASASLTTGWMLT